MSDNGDLKNIPVANTVSSLPWVKTTILCLLVFTFGRACVFRAISLMSSVYYERERKFLLQHTGVVGTLLADQGFIFLQLGIK